VRRLERGGIIQGYHARLDPFRLDVGLVLFAEITLKAHGSVELARFDSAIEAIPQIVEASHVSGAYDYLLKVVVADMAEWNRHGEQLTADAGADRINTHVLMRKPKVFVGYPVTVR
jgi:Lrp/AsnC family leucine-responsive transcriptional regulator